jgi:cytoskeleton protein RodZ
MKNNDLPTEQDLSVKQLLKETREAQKLSIDDIAKKLRISKSYLRALESNDENLTCDVYTLGFLRSYAAYLGLDSESLCKELKEKAAPPQVPQISFPAPLPGKGMPSRKILALSFSVLLVIVGGWWWFENSTVPTPYMPPSPKEEPLAEVREKPPAELIQVEAPAPVEPLESPQSLLPPLPEAVILKVSEPAWVEVKDKDGNVAVSRVFEPGESYAFKEPTNLLLKTGNAKGIELVYGDKTLSFETNNGTVKSNIPLDPEKWVEQIAETH